MKHKLPSPIPKPKPRGKKFFFFSDGYFDMSWPTIERVFEATGHCQEVEMKIVNKEKPAVIISKCDKLKAKYRIIVEEIDGNNIKLMKLKMELANLEEYYQSLRDRNPEKALIFQRILMKGDQIDDLEKQIKDEEGM